MALGAVGTLGYSKIPRCGASVQGPLDMGLDLLLAVIFFDEFLIVYVWGGRTFSHVQSAAIQTRKNRCCLFREPLYNVACHIEGLFKTRFLLHLLITPSSHLSFRVTTSNTKRQDLSGCTTAPRVYKCQSACFRNALLIG